MCGHHPERKSQVLPVCRGTRKSSVLPGTHVRGQGELVSHAVELELEVIKSNEPRSTLWNMLNQRAIL